MKLHLYIKSHAQINTKILIDNIVKLSLDYGHEICNLRVFSGRKGVDAIGSMLEIMKEDIPSHPALFLIDPSDPASNAFAFLGLLPPGEIDFEGVIFITDDCCSKVFANILVALVGTRKNSLCQQGEPKGVQLVLSNRQGRDS